MLVYAINRSPRQNIIGNFAFETSNTGKKCTEGEKSLLFFFYYCVSIIPKLLYVCNKNKFRLFQRINFVFSMSEFAW